MKAELLNFNPIEICKLIKIIVLTNFFLIQYNPMGFASIIPIVPQCQPLFNSIAVLLIRTLFYCLRKFA